MRTPALVMVLLLGFAVPLLAQGILIPVADGSPRDTRVPLPFRVKQHLVNVSIRDGVAETTIEQTFVNLTEVAQEAEYWFPVPEGAAVTRFTLTVGDRAVEARLLPKEEARRIYENIVRRRRDPALLEFAERNVLRARVFPIPPKGERRIQLRYTETLRREGEVNRYLLPLRATRAATRPTDPVGYVRVRVEIATVAPLTNVYCPSHSEAVVKREGANRATIEWSAETIIPERDLQVYYTTSTEQYDLRVLTYRTTGDGYFLLLLAPNGGQQPPRMPRHLVFVFDRTGSMGGDKIKQAKEALAYCVRNLQPEDRFNVILFNEQPQKLFDGLVPVTRENVEKAVREVEALTAQGGTNIADALREALRLFPNEQRNVLQAVVFLTDGLPTVGETDPQRILSAVDEMNQSRRVRVFAFGVGYDVNVNLLDTLCQRNRGIASYVRPEENIEARVSAFYNAISVPVLADLKLFCEGVDAYDLYPRDLPDLFAGDQVVVAGRYRGSGRGAVVLEAMSRQRQERIRHVVDFPDRAESMDFIPRLWAMRKIGYLMDEVRLRRNQEVIDEIVRLAREYGIVTEYTSFLIDEDMILARGDDRRVSLRAREFVTMLLISGLTLGKGAVDASVRAQALQRQGTGGAAAPPAMAGLPGIPAQSHESLGLLVAPDGTAQRAQQVVRNIGGRTFYQQGRQWMDSRYQSGQQVIKVQAFSDAHFALLRRRPELRQYLSLGEEVLVQLERVAVQIAPDGKTDLTEDEWRLIEARA
ncbi:MAG: VWA domain-containing protein [Firmicutes bacterium]|nr:VWA domain-containing protein [Bacillota bacterium]